MGKKTRNQNFYRQCMRYKRMYQKQNRLLHSDNQMGEDSHKVNVSAAVINQGNLVMSFISIVSVSILNGGRKLNTYGFLDSGSTVLLIDQSIQEKLQAQCTHVWLKIAGIHGTKILKPEKDSVKLKGLHSNVNSIEAFKHPSFSMGSTNYD